MKKVKCLLKSVLPCLAALFLTVIAYFAAFALSVILGLTSVSTVEGALVDEGLFNLLRFVMIIIFCGYLYSRKVEVKESIKNGFKTLKQPKVIIPIVIIAILLQLIVSLLIYILENMFHGIFTEYTHMETALKLNRSILYLIGTVIAGPIAEEMVFRGLTLKILREEFSYVIAIIIQALLFGVYHGNVIQFVYASLMGILFGFMVKKYDSIIPGIVMHAIINASFFFMPF